MARPKEFDPDNAMREAMAAFWQHGYHATSVTDLLSEMKLNRGSLYGTFGDKKKLFLAALAEYEKQGREAVAAALEQPGSARQALGDWIADAAKSCTGEAGLRGCLALKAAMEMAPQDKDIAQWVRDITHDRELLIARTIRRGQAEGEINQELDARVLARFLMSALAGLKVMGTASPSERELRGVVELIIRAMD